MFQVEVEGVAAGVEFQAVEAEDVAAGVTDEAALQIGAEGVVVGAADVVEFQVGMVAGTADGVEFHVEAEGVAAGTADELVFHEGEDDVVDFELVFQVVGFSVVVLVAFHVGALVDVVYDCSVLFQDAAGRLVSGALLPHEFVAGSEGVVRFPQDLLVVGVLLEFQLLVGAELVVLLVSLLCQVEADEVPRFHDVEVLWGEEFEPHPG